MWYIIIGAMAIAFFIMAPAMYVYLVGMYTDENNEEKRFKIVKKPY